MRTLLLAALLGVWACPLLAADPPPEKAPADQTITALGTGTAVARPDAADVRLAVGTEAASAAAARTNNKTVIEALLRRLDELGVPKKDVETYRAAALPQYLRNISDVQEREVVGYKLTSEVHVKVRDLDRLDKILDDLAAQDPKLVQEVRLVSDNPRRAYDEACRKAMAEARRKAEAMAGDAGVDLGEVLKVEEQPSDKPSSYATDRQQPKQPKEGDYSPPPSPRPGQERSPSTDRQKPPEQSSPQPAARDDHESRVTVAVTYAVRPHRKIESQSRPKP
jgi:uncharacterized protein YggE